MTESELVINQVLDEIKQSIILINESLGSEKHDTSSLSNLSLSTILDICDIQIVDELPTIQTRTEDLLVIPFEDSQASLSISRTHNEPSDYIILASPGPVSLQNEAIESSSWTYHNDCESTSEGSFLTEGEDEDENSDSEIDMNDLDRSFRNNSNFNLEKNEDYLHKASNCNDFIERFGRNNLNDSSNDEHYKEIFPLSFSSNIPLLCESFTESQENSRSIQIDSTNILKRQLVTEIEDERNFKMVKCDSQLSIGRDKVFY